MQVIRTTKYATLRRLWLVAIILVFLCAAVPVLADTPPKALIARVVTGNVLVHDGKCNVESMDIRATECLLYYDKLNGIGWIVLFSIHQGEVSIMQVILVKNGQESVAWCRTDVCV
jgi:hypothetical protein